MRSEVPRSNWWKWIVWSSVALNSPTGMDTNPKEIAPVQIARAMEAGYPQEHALWSRRVVARALWATSWLRGADSDRPGCAVQGHLLARLDAARRLRYPDHRGDAVLAGYHGAVGVGAAHLHHQPAGRQEERGPARVGGGGDEDLAGLQVGAHRVEHHPGAGGHGAGRRGRAGEGAVVDRAGTADGLRLRAVGQQHARDV